MKLYLSSFSLGTYSNNTPKHFAMKYQVLTRKHQACWTSFEVSFLFIFFSFSITNSVFRIEPTTAAFTLYAALLHDGLIILTKIKYILPYIQTLNSIVLVGNAMGKVVLLVTVIKDHTGCGNPPYCV